MSKTIQEEMKKFSLSDLKKFREELKDEFDYFSEFANKFCCEEVAKLVILYDMSANKLNLKEV